MERTLLILKPDAVQRGLIGAIVTRFESKGMKIVGMRMLRMTREQAAQLYAQHAQRKFFHDLVEFVTSSPAVAVALEGENAISRTRKLIGETLPDDATPGTVRGDYGADQTMNLVHASDGTESAARELALMFSPSDLLAYERSDQPWLTS